MILEDVFELTMDIINKKPIIAKVFSKKVFKLNPSYWFFGFKMMFILILLINYSFVEKKDGKRDLFQFISFNSFKTVFISLA